MGPLDLEHFFIKVSSFGDDVINVQHLCSQSPHFSPSQLHFSLAKLIQKQFLRLPRDFSQSRKIVTDLHLTLLQGIGKRHLWGKFYPREYLHGLLYLILVQQHVQDPILFLMLFYKCNTTNISICRCISRPGLVSHSITQPLRIFLMGVQTIFNYFLGSVYETQPWMGRVSL